jgi:cyanophycin synthetase
MLQLRKVFALSGPNIWARVPVLEAWVELDESHPPVQREIVADRLWAWLSPLGDGRESLLNADTWRERFRSAADAADLLGLAALALQQLSRALVERMWRREGGEPRTTRLAIELEEESLARACLDAARTACLAAATDQSFDAATIVQALREKANSTLLGPSTRAIVVAAHARGIPSRRLTSGSLVQLGEGIHQRRIWTAVTDRTAAIAQGIASDKDQTKERLRLVGVPVPTGRPVTSPEDAWVAACEIGLPVVVKPRDANHARGVSLNLTSREHIETAYAAAAAESDCVLVEKFALGTEHRVLVVGDRVVAATRAVADEVTGDGQQTVEALVAEANRDPRRGEDWRCQLDPIALDPPALIMLSQQGYTQHSVPPAGARVVLRRNGDCRTDVTDHVHPEVASCAVAAARAVGLDIAGLDLIADDISRPLEAQGGVVVEVNAGPSLFMHLEPREGEPRPVGEAIVDLLFPPGGAAGCAETGSGNGQASLVAIPRAGRIPIVAVWNPPSGSQVAAIVARMLQHAGLYVGLDCHQGTTVDGRSVRGAGECSGKTAAAVLMNPQVQAAVLESTPQAVLSEGLGFDGCEVAVLFNLPVSGEMDDSAAAAGAMIESILPGGALVVRDDVPVPPAWLEGCAVVRYATAGKPSGADRCVWLQENAICYSTAEGEAVAMAEVPAAMGTTPDEFLAAVAALLAVGVPPQTIAAGLNSGDPQLAVT